MIDFVCQMEIVSYPKTGQYAWERQKDLEEMIRAREDEAKHQRQRESEAQVKELREDENWIEKWRDYDARLQKMKVLHARMQEMHERIDRLMSKPRTTYWSLFPWLGLRVS